MNPDGSLRSGATKPSHKKEELLNVYTHMIRLRVPSQRCALVHAQQHHTVLHAQEMDYYFNEAQRQGRISFYMQASGEEAIHFGCASAMKAGQSSSLARQCSQPWCIYTLLHVYMHRMQQMMKSLLSIVRQAF